MRTRRAGFTLIELMIVLAIIGISAAMAIAAVAGNKPRTRLVASISDIRVELLRTRTQAMKTQKYVKLCFWNDPTPFDDTSAGLMLLLECRTAGSAGCAQQNNVCQGTAASPSFAATTVDPSSTIDPATGTCDAEFWCVKSGTNFGAIDTTTIAGVAIEGRGAEHVSINRFWTGSPAVPGTEGTAAILETTFDSAAKVNQLRTTTGALSGAVELTNFDQCVNAAGSPTSPGAGCVNFLNRIRASYSFGGAVRIQE